MSPQEAVKLDTERRELLDKLRSEMRKPSLRRDRSVSAWRARIHEITRLLRSGGNTLN
jgi:hypothetical protein